MDELDSPVDLPADPVEERGLGWTTASILVASGVLLLANAVSLSDWIEDKPPGAVQAQAAAAAGSWTAITREIGIGVPRLWLHAGWKQAEEARFGHKVDGEKPAGPDQR